MITYCSAYTIHAVDIEKTYHVKPSLFLGRTKNSIVALNQINFRVPMGQVLGLIGHNGAGKSTLLKVIAGIASPTSGSIKTKGKICSLLNLSAGLNLFQTGRENIYNLLRWHSCFHVTQKLIDDIIQFSDLENFIDEKIYTYSSGMRIRLAFAICTSMPCDILLLDEALAVGDEFFAVKSFRKIEELTKNGTTCVITSHDWTKIFRISNHIIWLEKGKIKKQGKPTDLLYDYLENVNAFHITRDAVISDIKIEHQKNAIKMNFSLDANANIKDIAFIVEGLNNLTGESLFTSWSLDKAFAINNIVNKKKFLSVEFKNTPDLYGDYRFSMICLNPDEGPFPTTLYALADASTHPELRVHFKKDPNSHKTSLNPLFHFPHLTFQAS